MTLQEVLHVFEATGTEQARKTYSRHAPGENTYGVSFAELGKLQKKIKKDHLLARELWASGSYEARSLATMIADPTELTDAEAESWVRDIDSYALTGMLSGLVARSPFAHEKGEAWTHQDAEWVERTGWLVLSSVATSDKNLPNSHFEALLARVKAEIGGAKNRVKDAMNSLLITMATRNAHLHAMVLEALAAIGKIEVDHGDTDCKTPGAAEYIQKMLARKGYLM
jgi:3-methyladenine DNA glycosylase AlkD